MVAVATMRERFQLAGGGVFTCTDRTLVVPVHNLALVPPADTLMVGTTLAVLVTAGVARRVTPADAVAIVDLANARRVAEGLPVLELPRDFRRVVRHAALSPTVPLPWPAADSLGFPGRTDDTARSTLYVHRVRGDAVLVTDTTPTTGSFRLRATTPPTWTVERMPRRLAATWLAGQGYAVPAVLVTGSGGHEKPGGGHPGP